MIAGQRPERVLEAVAAGRGEERVPVAELRALERDLEAARAAGSGHLRTVLLHILPSALAPVLVTTAFAVAAVALGASLALWLGLRVRQLHGRGVTLGTGLISGAVNGAAAVGGLPVVLYFLSASAPAKVVRATLMVYLVFLGCYGLAVASWQGLVNADAVLRGAVFCLPLVFGVALGNHRFLNTSPESFRRFALLLLSALALLGLARALA